MGASTTQGGGSPGLITQQSGGTQIVRPSIPLAPSTALQPHTVPQTLDSGLPQLFGTTVQSVPQASSTGLQLGTVPQAVVDSGPQFNFSTVPQGPGRGLQQIFRATSTATKFSFQPGLQVSDMKVRKRTVKKKVDYTLEAPSLDIPSSPSTDAGQPVTAHLQHPNRSPTIQQASFVQLPRLQQTSVAPSPTKPAFKIVDVVCKSSLK